MTATLEDLRTTVNAYLPEISDPAHRDVVVARLADFAAKDGHSECALQDGLLGSGTVTDVGADINGAPVVHLPGSPEVPYAVDTADPRLGHWFRALALDWTRVSRQRLRTNATLAVPGQFENDMLDHVTELISTSLLRTLLDVLRGRRETGALIGTGPAERFEAFRQWLASADGQQFLRARHGSVLQHAHLRTKAFVRHVEHVVHRFAADRSDLNDVVPGVAADALIHRVTWGSGDTHNGGRSVAVIELDRGCCVVYKPRDLAGDAAYHATVGFLTQHGAAQLRSLAVLQRDGYGWVEHVRTRAEVGSPSRPEDYFRRIGELTALLHVLRATDVHYENLVTDTDDCPVVVDTETLLTPRPRTDPAYDDGAAAKIGMRQLTDSVAGIGILPLSVSVPGRDAALDIGAIGYTEEQTSPFRSHVLREAGRDTMHLDFVSLPLAGTNDNPVIAGKNAQEVLAHRDAVKAGFRRVMTWIHRHHNDVRHFLREQFAGVTLRYIHAPTVFYAQLLRTASHPSLWQNPHGRLAVLGRVHARDRYSSSDAVPRAEMRQLAAGDVPYFVHRVGSTNLATADGTDVQRDFFHTDGLQLLDRGLEESGPSAVNRQSEIIDSLFVRLIPDQETGTGVVPSRLDRVPGPSETSEPDLLRVLQDNAHDIMRRMIRSTDARHPATWVAPLVTTADSRQWVPGTLGYDLYGGSPGQALALTGVGVAVGDQDLVAAADLVLHPIEEQLVNGALDGQELSLGAMTGMSGTVWALATSRRLTGRPAPERIRACLEVIARKFPDPQSPAGIDFTSGVTGAVALANALWRNGDVPNDDLTRTLIRDLGSRLSTRITAHLPSMRAESENPGQTAEPLYTGYAHGLAGITPHLFEYGHVWGDSHATAVAENLSALLAGAFDGTDWRRRPGTEEKSWAWCHGAPGLLHSWAGARNHAPGVSPTTTRQRLEALTLARGLGSNSTYCHGDLGSLDALLEANLSDPRPGTADRIRASTAQVVRHRLSRAPQHHTDRYAYTDSFMVGRSGHLWAGLRCTDPVMFPSALVLG